MTPIVQIDHLTRRYRGQLALDDVSCELQADTVTGLLGRNGVGKSTLMRILTGQEFPSSGLVLVDGENPLENDAVLRRMVFVKESQVGSPDVVVGGGEGWQHAYPRGDLVGETVRRQVDEVVSERSE